MRAKLLSGNLKGRNRRRCEGNIKMNVKSCRGLNCPGSFEYENGSSFFTNGEYFFE
jgi:hypothetical protein